MKFLLTAGFLVSMPGLALAQEPSSSGTCLLGGLAYSQGIRISIGATSYTCQASNVWQVETRTGNPDGSQAACIYASQIYSSGAQIGKRRRVCGENGQWKSTDE